MAGAAESATATALTIMVIAEIPNFWSAPLPSLFTISTFAGGDEEKVRHTTRWIRRGEVQAATLSVLLGAAAAALTRKPWPLLGALGMTAFLLYQYENALKQGCTTGLKMDMDKPDQNVNSFRIR